MNPLVEDWISGGNPISVVTRALEGESQHDHETRHASAVHFWKEVFPED